MKPAIFLKKLRHAFWILRKEGPLSLLIIILVSIQKKYRMRIHGSKYKQKINVIARYSDVIKVGHDSKFPEWPGTTKNQLTFNWLMPPPGKGSGGHLNIFRFIKYLEDAGHTSRIYLYTSGEHGTIQGVQAAMGNSYPQLNASMQWLESDQEMAAADGIFATSWETAYPAFNSTLNSKRFYFVQDFEPYFYPTGSLSTLAENTYKFGFYGVTAGGWLAKKLNAEYGMKTDHFSFGADKAIYNFTNSEARKEILFYVRPFTERRGFEIGIMALDLFHQKHPDYTINLVGWDVSEYDVPFPYKNLKTLEIHELNELYNKCAAGLVMSLTNMSLLPLELLSSGTIPVVNEGDNNRLVSNNSHIAFSSNAPLELANTLSEIVSRADLPSYAKIASESVLDAGWDQAGAKFVSIVERETKKHG